MSEQSAAHQTLAHQHLLPAATGLDHDSEMSEPDNAIASATGSAPNIETLLENMVKARMDDWERQAAEQVRAWNEQEIAMRTREQALLQELKILKEKLAVAEASDTSRPSAGTAIVLPVNTETSEVAIATSGKKRKRSKGPFVPPDSSAQVESRPPRVTRSLSRRNVDLATEIPGQPQLLRNTRSTSRRNPSSGAAANPVNVAGAQDKRITKKKKRNVVKSAVEVFRYLPQDMPDDMGGLNKAMALHIRVLWGLADAKEVPKNPPAQMLMQFHRNFSTEAELYISQASGEELIPRHLVQIGISMSAQPGRIAAQARLVEEHMLDYIQACLSKFGFSCWCPDMRLSAYSLYNAACRIVALDTFKQALVSHVYAHLSPNTKYASNMKVLVLLYDHFVFHYMKGRYQKEDRNPGTIANELQKSPQYMARIRLANARLKFLIANNYPKRYRDLIDAKATSDDEYDPSQKAWVVKRRPERSAKAHKFFRLLDVKRREAALQAGSRSWRERKRVVPNVQEDSQFHSLPEHMPIDYFDPAFFNKLQPKTRNRIAIAKASLLPDIDQSFTWNADERHSDKTFTKKYGAALLTQYAMVSDADMEVNTDEESTDDEWAGINDEDTMTQKADTEDVIDLRTVTSSRDNISSHLSASASLFSSQNLSMSETISGGSRQGSRPGSMESIHQT